MSDTRQTSCPHCHAVFMVNNEQLKSAEGKVRCGVCLRVFDGTNGEAEFVPPPIPEEAPPNPLLGLALRPMEGAELPQAPRAAPRGLKILVVLLTISLLAQLAWNMASPGRSRDPALSIAQLVVRAHPEREQALLLDAILHIDSDEAHAYPALFLYLDNRYGERRAQRLFMPFEYLPERLVESGELAAHTRVQVSLALQDPGQGSVNYGLALQALPAAEN